MWKKSEIFIFFLNAISPRPIYWPLHAAPLSDRWRHYKLIGCWNKWRPLHSKHGLWGLDKLSDRCHRQLAWVELRRTSWHRCNFSCNRFVLSWIFRANWTYESNSKWNKTKACSRVASSGVSCYSELDFHMLPTPTLKDLKWIYGKGSVFSYLCEA